MQARERPSRAFSVSRLITPPIMARSWDRPWTTKPSMSTFQYHAILDVAASWPTLGKYGPQQARRWPTLDRLRRCRPMFPVCSR